MATGRDKRRCELLRCERDGGAPTKPIPQGMPQNAVDIKKAISDLSDQLSTMNAARGTESFVLDNYIRIVGNMAQLQKALEAIKPRKAQRKTKNPPGFHEAYAKPLLTISLTLLINIYMYIDMESLRILRGREPGSPNSWPARALKKFAVLLTISAR